MTDREGSPVARLRQWLGDWKDVRAAFVLGLGLVAGALAATAMTLAAGSLVLMGLWYVLRWVTAPLRWAIGLVRGPA